MDSNVGVETLPLMSGSPHPASVFLRSVVIGLVAFLSVVDLFATQAILPTLARAYGVSAATTHAPDDLARFRGSRAGSAVDARSEPGLRPGRHYLGRVGTLFAQAVATSFVGRAATTDRASASGIYLACYFSGGLVGSALLGQVFDRLGWTACLAGVGAALAIAALLAVRLRLPT